MDEMPVRKIGGFTSSAIGLGCMNLSHAYGTPLKPEAAARALERALDFGYTHLDTAALYGFGANEELIAAAVGHRRGEYLLASKGGMFRDDSGKRVLNGHPKAIRQNCVDSLKRLKTEVIDLYYLHRWDRRVPIEESVGAMGDLVAEGKVRAVGLSEVSAATLLKAHAETPITAVQSEYSLWTRNPEIAVLEACTKIGAAFVAFSPLGRGFLTGTLTDVATLVEGDIRRPMPRFAPDVYTKNLKLLREVRAIAKERECTMAQLALGWLLAKAPHIVPIPGTRSVVHMEENAGSVAMSLDVVTMERLDAAINQRNALGARYQSEAQADVDTEEFEEERGSAG